MLVVLVQLVSPPPFSALSIPCLIFWNVFFVHPFRNFVQEKPYSRELCVKCSSCFRGIHQDCLTKQDCDVLDSEGVFCSVCTAMKKKRQLTFSSNTQRSPPSPKHTLTPEENQIQPFHNWLLNSFSLFHCSQESKVAPPVNEAKRPRTDPSERAVKIQRKRAIEKIFSQEQQESNNKANSCDSDDETSSYIDFEVGGHIKSIRYNFFIY